MTQPHNAGRRIIVVRSAIQRDVSPLCVSLTQVVAYAVVCAVACAATFAVACTVAQQIDSLLN